MARTFFPRTPRSQIFTDINDMYGLPSVEAVAPRNGDQTLTVGIVGAGISGLTAAIALAESGHDVEASALPSGPVLNKART